VPLYTDIKNIATEYGSSFLLASAALPAGIVDPIINPYDPKQHLVDGAVVDNLPILPLLDSNLDIILVVSVNRIGQFNNKQQVRNLKRNLMILDRLSKLGSFRDYKTTIGEPQYKMRTYMRLVPYRKIKRLPKIIVFQPFQDIHNFKEIIDFDKKRISKLIELGHSDATKILIEQVNF
jgi:predicted acylesterase/phospholipase RssA